jgi:predicted nucleic acid-binding protein
LSVLDASAAIELLFVGAGARGVRERLVAEGGFAAPEVITVEVMMVLRRDLQRGVLREARAEEALEDLLALPLTLFSPRLLARRAWSLRSNLTVPDALYLALAEAIGEPLLTADVRLARAAASTAAEVVVVED